MKLSIGYEELGRSRPKAEVDNTLRDQFNSSYPTKAESLIALLVIQNNSQFKNKLNHAYLRRCQVHLINGCLEDKGLYRSANILQIANSVHRVVFLLFFRQQFVVKRVKCSAECSTIFVFTNKATQPSPQVFPVNGALTCKRATFLTSSVD